MKKFFYVFCLLLLFMDSAVALQASYMYVSLSYGSGWWPWVCVTEAGVKGGSAGSCDGRPCPFEDGTMTGNACSIVGLEDVCPNITDTDDILKYEECLEKFNLIYGSEDLCQNITDATMLEECLEKEANKTLVTWSEYLWPPAWGLVTKISIPEDLKYVDSGGNVLVDEICRGDTVHLDKGVLRGEYWQDGGHEDSPPIYWVDDVESVVDKLMDYHEIHQTSLVNDILGSGGKPNDGFLDPLLKIPVYTIPVTLHYTEGDVGDAYLTGSFICSLKKKAGADELIKGGVAIKKTEKTDYMTFSTIYDVECMYFYYGGSGGWSFFQPFMSFRDGIMAGTPGEYQVLRVPTVIQAGPDATYEDWAMHSYDFQSKEDFFKVGTIGIDKTLRIVDPAMPKVDVSVAGGESIKFGESNILRVLVKNMGDVNVSIKSVNSRPVGKLISCDSGVLSPGQQGECLFSVIPMLGDGVSVQVSYDYTSCGRSQVGLETKTLIASNILVPVLSEQVYSMGVHGDCENSYYACNKADNQPSIFAGYKCYKTSNGFFTPTTERFNLKFDLSSLPKGLVISGARLNLYSNAVGKVQSVGVYSIDMDWKAVQCVPGGDICARPYCSECAPVYDLGGVLQSTQSVKSADRYSFDVSALVKDKYSAGDSSVSLQVRGVEGLWESGGQSMCSVPDNWENLDVSFDSLSGNGPYLEIVYKQ